MRSCLPLCAILVALLAIASTWQSARAIDGSVDAWAAEQPFLFVIGVPATLLDGVHRAISARFGARALASSVPVDDEDALEGAAVQEARTVIALGRDACAAVILVRYRRPILCALLYEDAFRALDCADTCDHVEAIVLDQPPERQARIATTLFPALQRFGTLREAPLADIVPGITSRAFDPPRRLSAQLTELLAFVDAIIVEPRVRIYPPRSLRTVLLTAYGWDRPIIGYGPDWVRAGALVSAWSTPDDVLRDVQHTLFTRRDARTRAVMRVQGPQRFHVAENPAVARSLGLRRMPFDTDDRPFVDEDFLP